MSCCPIFLYGFEPVNLDANTWWIHDGFDKNWVTGEIKPDLLHDWRKKDGLPLHVSNFVDIGRSQVTYTFLTYFDIDEKLDRTIKTMGLFLPAIGEGWQIYINGHLIADELLLDEDGTIKINRTVRGKLVNFSSAILKPEKNILGFRITGNPGFWRTGLFLNSGYEIDEYRGLSERKSEILVFMFLAIYLFIGLYYLIFFISRFKEKLYLYFGLLCISSCFYFFTRTNLIFDLYTRSDIILRAEYIVLFTIFPFFLFCCETLLFKKISLLALVYSGICGLLIAAMPFIPYTETIRILLAWQVTAFVIIVYILFIFIKTLGQKNRDALYIMAGILVLCTTVVYDLLDSIYINSGNSFSKYGFFIFLIGIAARMANRFISVSTIAEDLNVNLEEKVKERTEKLTNTLDEMKALKEQQDGDYYLTSLLMKPLLRIDAKSINVVVKEFTKQKKSFVYNNKDVQLGGDLCISTNISLHGRDYIAFINSDAMGKSLQGAGGALITGVLYNSFLNRTRITTSYRMRYPERWIKECFSDLQNMFMTFDGQMLATLIMGLVDIETGYMYYVNAEHPMIVLYRDGKAQFFEDACSMRMVGMEVDNSEMRISTFQLLSGDTIIMGSDGKDDILMGVDDEGNRIINENENLFLKHVEDGEGDIKIITDNIQNAGELMDDLTLLSISFHPEKSVNPASFVPEDEMPDDIKEIINRAETSYDNRNFVEALSLLRTAQEKTDNNPVILKKIMKLYIRSKKFRIASDAGEQFSDLCPRDTELLYLTSYASKMIDDYERAADFGERCKLREPGLAKNLFNLADVYRLLGNKVKAEKLLNEGFEIDKEDEQALKLKLKLTGSKAV